MPLSSSYDIRKKIEIVTIISLIVVSFIYGIIKAYPLLIGPRISVYYPQDGDTVPRTIFELSGKVSRVKEITVNGRPIPIGTDGHFTEIMVAQSPYTILVLHATDFYGKSTSKILRVVPE